MPSKKKKLTDKVYHDWLPKDILLNPFYEGVAEFVEKYAPLPTDKKKSNSRSKVFLDPCVGYIELNSWEVAIVDTPLYQRLRYITQLGLAYLVYPTLKYSRFEHSLGVLGRMNQAIERLRIKHKNGIKNERGGDHTILNIEDILKKYETHIRIAALTHDIGHCLFSHLSESVITELKGNGNYPSADLIRDRFNKEFESGNLAMGEILTMTILSTKRFAEILHYHGLVLNPDNVHIRHNDINDIIFRRLIEGVVRLVAGLPIKDKPETIFLAQLMSSGLDADKLDYMSREEHFSGIKIEMDLERILQKIKLFAISNKSEIPKGLAKFSSSFKKTTTGNFVVLGIERGGQFSYEEFCVARLALYEKIYLHKKVRSAEQLLKKRLSEFCERHEEFQKAHRWLYLTENLILPNGYIIDQEQTVVADLFDSELSLSVNSIPKLTQIEVNTSQVYKRDIPYRAYGFGPANSRTDDNRKENINERDSIKLWKILKDVTYQKSFIEMIVIEAIKVMKCVDNCEEVELALREEVAKLVSTDVETEVTTRKLRDSLILDIPDHKRVLPKIDTLYFEETNYEIVRWTIPIDKMAESYQLHRILAYVYCDEKFCPYVNIACQKIFYANSYSDIANHLYFDQSGILSKEAAITYKEIFAAFSKNEDENYFRDSIDLMPIDEQLESHSALEKINQLIHDEKQLKLFKAPKKQISVYSTQIFLNQFPSKLRLPALNLLTSIRVLDEDLLIGKIKEILDEKPDVTIGIMPLSGETGSGAHMLKALKCFDGIPRITVLGPGVFSDSFLKVDELIIYDDNINSSLQALNIFATWLDVPTDENSPIFLNKMKTHVANDAKPLSGHPAFVGKALELVKQAIRTKPKTFVFIAGHETSPQKLKENLETYCDIIINTNDVRICHILREKSRLLSGDSTREVGDESVFSELLHSYDSMTNIKDKIELKQFLEKIGEQLVTNRKIVTAYGKNPKEHALGYHNRESTILFRNSIPKMTLTALWCGGEYHTDERDHEGNRIKKIWKPLLIVD